MNGNISRKYLSQKVVLGFPFVWRTGSQMLDGWEKEIKLLFRIPFGHEWKDISTRSVTKKVVLAFPFERRKFLSGAGQSLVVSSAVLPRQIEMIAAKAHRLTSSGKQKKVSFSLFSWHAHCTWEFLSSFPSLNLWVHCWGICGQKWGWRLKNTWHAQVSLKRPQLDCLCQINWREKCQTLNPGCYGANWTA